MQKLFYIILLTTALSACNKNDDYTSSSPLPPATQTGKNILACKVDGKSFIHKGSLINCFYQLVDGEYYFGISGENNGNNPMGIHLGTFNRTISENEILILSDRANGNTWGAGFFNTSEVDGESSYTNSEYTGELHITKFDPVTHIVSGTFWFDVQHPVTGERVEIREGRFDAKYGG
ncbi:hypothetical protein ACX0HA_01125 [Flavobacterium hauense]